MGKLFRKQHTSVVASCGGNSCNYPSSPMGFWHETGHGLGLPHSTPPRYEKWAYRSYDLKFLPNYHPDPLRYGLGVDYLGLHYFGHVVGSLAEPAWPDSAASAPLVDEFEALRSKNPLATADWRHYIAPYTHQQMLRVQQRFGSFPAGLQYADLWDDHRSPPKVAQAQGLEAQAVPEQLIDPGIDEAAHDIGTQLKLTQPGQVPLGVFQGSCRVNRLTMLLFSQRFALDPGLTARCRSVPSCVSPSTTALAFSLWLARTAHVAWPGSDGPALDAAQSVSRNVSGCADDHCCTNA
ncbi:hypothetical protein BV326_05874 [Pseudomonas syringae pv. actinidiae]|nr:hypothetical protein BV326_05874 [Pseudomonas syringae pv. actinidiae]